MNWIIVIISPSGKVSAVGTSMGRAWLSQEKATTAAAWYASQSQGSRAEAVRIQAHE